jgi:hypothetical protein
LEIVGKRYAVNEQGWRCEANAIAKMQWIVFPFIYIYIYIYFYNVMQCDDNFLAILHQFFAYIALLFPAFLYRVKR